MEKEFIHYELALELKELGFDEECFSYVKHLGYDSSKEKVRVLSEVSRSQIEDMGLPLLKIPTFSQAFRWFREKYGLYPDIYRNGVKFNACIEDMITGNSKETVTDKGVEYEEAELKCLKKLIEIVKEK